MADEPISYYYKPGGRLHRAGRGEISAQVSDDCTAALELLEDAVVRVAPYGGPTRWQNEWRDIDDPSYMMDIEEMGRDERLTLEFSLPRAAHRVVKYCLPRGVRD